MIKLLEKVRCGAENASALTNFEMRRRLLNFSESQTKRFEYFESEMNFGISHMQGDPVEHRFLLVGRIDGELSIYDTMSESLCKRLWQCARDSVDAHSSLVSRVSWFPRDNGIFVTSSTNGQFKIWDASHPLCVDNIQCDHITSFSLSPALQRNCSAAVCTKSGVRIMELHTGCAAHVLQHNRAFSCDWCPMDDNLVATGGLDCKAMIWDVRSSRSCLFQLDAFHSKSCDHPGDRRAHWTPIVAVKFAQNGRRLITFDKRSEMKLWDTFDGTNLEVDYNMGRLRGGQKCAHIELLHLKPELALVPVRDGMRVVEVESGRYLRHIKPSFAVAECSYYQPIYNELYLGTDQGTLLLWNYPITNKETEEQWFVNPSLYYRLFCGKSA